MKIQPARIEGFVTRPDERVRAALIYGPDVGLVRERADRLCGTVVHDLRDPFRVVELSSAALRDDPARLADEAAQIAMIGGRRVVRIREATDAITGVVTSFLDAPVGDALIVIEAGDLPARSKLRGLFEAAETGAAIPCYIDSEDSIAGVAREVFGAAGLKINPDALDDLTARLGSDRQLTRRELEKICLYMGQSGAEVGVADVEACIGDGAAHSIEDALVAAADGEPALVDRALARCFAEGESAVGVVRAAQRYFQRLHFVAAEVARGTPAERAVDSLRPKLFWKVRPRFLRQLTFWKAERAAQALERLTQAEIVCKSTGLPDQAIVTRCLLEFAGAAGRARRRH